jgi:hypothetical protein
VKTDQHHAFTTKEAKDTRRCDISFVESPEVPPPWNASGHHDSLESTPGSAAESACTRSMRLAAPSPC